MAKAKTTKKRAVAKKPTPKGQKQKYSQHVVAMTYFVLILSLLFFTMALIHYLQGW